MTIEVSVTIEGRSCLCECDYEPLRRGNISGPPEHCYPDEGGFASVLRVHEGDADVTEWFEELSEGAQSAAEETCFAACEELSEEANAWSGAMEDDDASP